MTQPAGKSPDARRCQGQLPRCGTLGSERVCHSACDRRAWSVDANLANASGPCGRERGRRLDHFERDWRYVGGRWQVVLAQGRTEELTVIVIDKLLKERAADALYHRTDDLAGDRAGVDQHAAVGDGDVAHNRHLTGGGVNVDNGHVGAVGRGLVRRFVRRDRLEPGRTAGRDDLAGLELPAPAGVLEHLGQDFLAPAPYPRRAPRQRGRPREVRQPPR